jgi:hypothetical protein
VSDEIRRADENTDDVVTEAWERATDEIEIRCVDAAYLEPYGQWSVGVAVMEFVREGDLPYDDLRRSIERALSGVEGVERVQREDTEVWIVNGTPSGRDLVAAVAQVVDDRADELRAWYNQLT